MIPFPQKSYKIIYADPPWKYNDQAGKRGASAKYLVQNNDWIANLPVKDISLDDSFLFIWVTMPLLPDIFNIIKSWGPDYKTVAFVWVKQNRSSHPWQASWFWGMGHYTRANAELCLLGIKGKPKIINNDVHQIISTPIGKHSEKPNEARKRIIRLCGDLPRIELFSRQEYPGWDSWGNEVSPVSKLGFNL